MWPLKNKYIHMKVLKFGGTSVGSVENVRRIGEIVIKQPDKIVVVVSALGGVTDQLHTVAQQAYRIEPEDSGPAIRLCV
jgi:aspartokinase